MTSIPVAEAVFKDFDFAGLASLDGSGRAVQTGETWFLEGNFVLCVAPIYRTDTIVFGPDSIKAVVYQDGGRWVVDSINLYPAVKLAGPAEYRRSADGPILRAEAVSVTKRPGENNAVRLSLADASIFTDPSLTADYVNALRMHNTGRKNDSVPLIPVPHPGPGGPAPAGFYVLREGKTYVLRCRTQEAFALQHVSNVRLTLGREVDLWFTLIGAASDDDTGRIANAISPLVIEAREQSKIRATVVPAAEVAIRVAAKVNQPLPIGRLAVTATWAAAVTFNTDSVAVQRRGARPPADRPTALVAATRKLRFYLWTGAAAAPSGGVPRAQFLYHDGQALTLPDRSTYTLQDRYDGLRIQGLGHLNSAQAKLDGNWIAIDLCEAGGSATFQYKAGVELQVPAAETRLKGGSVAGDGRSIPAADVRLVPKPGADQDGWRRRLYVPAGGMALRLDAAAARMMFDSARKLFTVSGAELSGPPMGVASGQQGSPGALAGQRHYLPWVLTRSDTMEFDADDHQFVPREGKEWPRFFRGGEQGFQFLQYPGSAIVMDPNSPGRPFSQKEANDAIAAVGNTELVVRKVGDYDQMVYEKLVTRLVYKVIPFDDESKSTIDDSAIVLAQTGLFGAPLPAGVSRNGGPDDLVLDLPAGVDGTDAIRAKIREFFVANSTKPNENHIVWPFLPGIACTVRDNEGKWFWELADGNGHMHSGIAFDLSIRRADEDDGAEQWTKGTILGWTRKDLDERAEKDRDLWPSKDDGSVSKSRYDPRDIKWRGILLRDFPLELNLPKAAGSLAEKLAKAIRENAILEYGWKDESGTTWSAGFSAYRNGKVDDDKVIDITPSEEWKTYIRIDLLRFGTRGAAGKPKVTDGRVRISFPMVPQEVRKDGKAPERIASAVEAAFVADLSGPVARIPRIELEAAGSSFTCTSIPGFSEVQITRLVIIDLAHVDVSLRVKPDSSLSGILPNLDASRWLDASIGLNLNGLPSFDLGLRLPAEDQTNLFGKWPFVLRGLRIKLEDSGGTGNALDVSGMLNLGLPSFGSIGAKISLKGLGSGKWDFSVLIDGISGSIDLGEGFYLAGGLYWMNEPPEDGTTPGEDRIGDSDIKKQAESRQIWGWVEMRTELLGTQRLCLRIGNVGEMTFWIAVLGSDTPIRLGQAELRKPALLIARHADRENGELTKVIGDASKPITGVLRFEDKDHLKRLKWLKEWKPSASVGFAVAASGYFHLGAAATEPENEEKYLTSIAFVDSGQLRIDAYSKVMGVAPVPFAVAIDLTKKRFTAGTQVPGFAFPPSTKDYEISPGYMSLGFNYAGDTFLQMSIGWPLSDPESLEPDWERAVMIRWDGAWPINTFWGGVFAKLEGTTFACGYALRAGWTKTYSEGIKGVASASAEVGVAVGGSVIFQFDWGKAATFGTRSPEQDLLFDLLVHGSALSGAMVNKISTNPMLLDVVQGASQLIADDVRLASVEGTVTATLYADVWGKASAELLGVRVASVEIRARACFRVKGGTKHGITEVYAAVGFEVRVVILCVEHRADALLELWLVKRGGSRLSSDGGPIWPLASLGQEGVLQHREESHG
ncbi:hypothetical protein [Azospirillum argentinense]